MAQRHSLVLINPKLCRLSYQLSYISGDNEMYSNSSVWDLVRCIDHRLHKFYYPVMEFGQSLDKMDPTQNEFSDHYEPPAIKRIFLDYS